MKIFSFIVFLLTTFISVQAEMADTFTDGNDTAEISSTVVNGLRQYTLKTSAELRDNRPADKTRVFTENSSMPHLRTGSLMFDGLYAMALDDARLNAVEKIRDASFTPTAVFDMPYYQTGEKWTHVWTRDVSYAVDLGLATLDQQRCANSLLFKTAYLKPGITGGYSRQIVQDTGSGGSYPVSTDRVVWAYAADELLKFLDGPDRQNFLNDAWQIIRDTIEHDRQVIFDQTDGLYRGEQSFLDWRVQSYPRRTGKDVVLIAQSKSLSTNIGQYWLIKTGAKIAAQKNMAGFAQKYDTWAAQLKSDINRAFYMDDIGQYSSLILEDYMPVRVNRFDTLGQALAILYGIADQDQASRIVANYPQGKYGPAVIWPQDKNVPIYHNQGIWPFVTAYWLKAAQKAQNSEAVNLSVYSLIRGAALNLSNMENFDFVTGKPYAKSNGIDGPVINSQRQLWSVAGYISMVQDVIFGMEATWDGIRFLPWINNIVHREYLGGSRTIKLNNLCYHGKTINITINLPDASKDGCREQYLIAKIKLNGNEISKEYINDSDLLKNNSWVVDLIYSPSSKVSTIQTVNSYSGSSIFGPTEPQLTDIKLNANKAYLSFDCPEQDKINFNIYKNGKLVAGNIAGTSWLDPEVSATGTDFYALEALYPDTGNVSFITETKYITSPKNESEISAAAMKNTGGNLVNNHHFENWGLPGHTLEIENASVSKNGQYIICVEYSNGSGQIYTGVTCAVKRLDIIESDTGKLVNKDYLAMPETEPDDGSASGWQTYRDSTRFTVNLKAGTSYKIKIFEDEFSRNMSYFDHYIPYKRTGGGEKPYNYVNISKVKLLFVK